MSDKTESVIETAHLLLRPMRREDVDDLLYILSDFKVMAAFGEAPIDVCPHFGERREQWPPA